MSDPYVGEIRLFAFQRAPTGWLACNGQTLPIAGYDALYAIIGTTYGGDGQTNFNLPNLQGRVALGQGQGQGLPSYVLGQAAGEESHTLVDAEMPAHSHALNSSTATADTSEPGQTLHLATSSAESLYAAPSNIPSYDLMAPCVAIAGGSVPHDNMMPTLVCNYCICVNGIFPSAG